MAQFKQKLGPVNHDSNDDLARLACTSCADPINRYRAGRVF